PTEEAERRRHKVIDYAKNLIGTTFGCEVFPFGSVPLKTYLPDGDVDITIITNTNLDDSFVQDVCCLLAAEQSSDDAEFALRDIQVINAK
uniref:Polymerase nucleotidyl transferase domain-containing protein n=4 Tax=Triticinae TaxID=1648030 RepID=A0A453AP31_AEGTS